VVLPDSIKRQRARRPKCLTKIDAPLSAPRLQPDAYDGFLSQSLIMPKRQRRHQGSYLQPLRRRSFLLATVFRYSFRQ
jgi:hypothetical protein